MSDGAQRRQVEAELAHWRVAIESLDALETVASPDAWRGLESYLQRGVRERMKAMVAELRSELQNLQRALGAGEASATVRRRFLRLRNRYLQAETIIDFFDDAISTRSNPAMAALLRGYDVLATDSMAATFAPLGMTTPLALVYVDKGLGAAILRAGVRLWDRRHPSPAAAIKLTRHNLTYPTALLHETGHQVGHQTGWNAELAATLGETLAPRSQELAEMWASWASEVAADVHAFVQAGWAPVAALANVVDGPSRAVFRIRPGDPHPFAWVRVMFNVALCRSWYGHGPWDDIGAAWISRHPLENAGRAGALARASLESMPDIVDVCTRQPMAAFRGSPITAHLDPRRVSPGALEDLATAAGPSLLTSSYLRRRESLRILSLLATRSVTEPQLAGQHRTTLKAWVAALGAEAAPATTPSENRAA